MLKRRVGERSNAAGIAVGSCRSLTLVCFDRKDRRKMKTEFPWNGVHFCQFSLGFRSSTDPDVVDMKGVDDRLANQETSI